MGAIAAMQLTILHASSHTMFARSSGAMMKKGTKAIYSFDLVGSYQKDSFKAACSASPLVQSLLDSQGDFKNMQNAEHIPPFSDRTPLHVKGVFISVSQRDL